MKTRKSTLFIHLSLLLTLLLGAAQSTVVQSRPMVLAASVSESKNLSSSEILDQFQTGVNYGFWFEDDVIRWQEFIPGLNEVSSVEVSVDKRGNPGNMIVEIRTTSETTLAQKIISEAEVPSYGWARAEFSTPVPVSPGTKYRIYVYSDTDSTSVDDRYFWRGNTASTYCPTCDTDVSGGWSTYDYAFKTFSTAAAAGAGYALQFDGADDFVSIADSGDFDFDEAFTLEVWAKPSSLSGSGSYKAFLGGGAAEPPSAGGSWQFFLDDADYSSWGLSVCVPGCQAAQSSSGSLQVNQWQHLAATYDGSNIRIYKNGDLVNTQAHSGNVSDVNFVLVGIWNTSFDGLIDEVRIWNITRTQTEIQANKDYSLNGDESGLVGYWKFDEGTGQVVNDSTGNNNAGRLGELSTSDDKDPVWVASDAPINAATGGSAAYIYSTDLVTANEFKALLDQNGVLASLVHVDDVVGTDFGLYDVILIGDETGYLSNWGDAGVVNALNQSGKPLLGLGEGGYALFGKLDLDIGYPHGWHGSATDIYVVDPSQPVFTTPYLITIPGDGILDLHTTAQHVGIYLPTPPGDVVLIGRESDNLTHYPLVQQTDQYLLWGFGQAPAYMSEIGKQLFINIVSYLQADHYAISGQVQDGDSNPMPGVTVSDGAGHSAITDSNGAFTLNGLIPGDYTLVPSKNGYTFSPVSRLVTVPPDATGQDFTSTPTSTLESDLYVLTEYGILRVSMSGSKETIIGAHGESYSLEILDNALYVSEQTHGGDILVYDLEGNYLRTIPIPSEASQYLDLVTLPDGRIALLDNSNDKVFFIDSSGSLLATTNILDSSDSELQNLDGIVVNNRLILSEDGENHVLQIDLDTYTRSIFQDLTSLPHWLGAITYAEGQYYICGPQKIYAFPEGGSAVEIAEIPENNITGIVVIDGFAYVSVNFAGKVYKVDLSDGTSSVLASDLNYPKDLEYLAATTAVPDIRITPNSLSFDLSLSLDKAALQSSVSPSAPSPLKIVQSDDTSLILDLTVPAAESSEVQIGRETFQRLTLPGEGSTNEVGRPQLPTLGRWIAIPAGTSATVQVLESAFTVMSGYKIYPAQEPHTDQGSVEPDFAIDSDFYQNDAFYPQPLVILEHPVDWRGTQAASLRIYPYQYNSKTGELRVYSHVRVKINFVTLDDAGSVTGRRSPYFDGLYRDLLLNYDETLAPNFVSQRTQQATEGADFLIVTAPEFETAANTLAAWRNLQGIATQVRTTSATGTTAAAIQAYIQNAYDTWSPAPSFVLLLGDAEFIPPHYQTMHPYHDTLLGTDLYYATVDGTDYFPDIALGRIAVDTAAQAEKAIDDIINYESSPVADESFYSRVAVAAYFQDGSPKDGYADRRFVLTSEEIRDYLLAQGYSVERIYTAHSSVNPMYYNNGAYATGAPLPSTLLRTNGFAWDGDRTDISNAVNAGVLILNHRDHGGFSGWGDPAFNVSDVNSLSNGNKLPVVFSINCQTGWFDNETDSSSDGTGYNDINFAEAWQRNSNGGAVGVIASTRVSYSGHNDALAKGFYDAIWPNFLSYTPSPGRFSNPQRRMGNVLNYGKLYYASQYSDSLTRQVEFEEFQYFGDPTTQIWTASPSQTQETFTIYNDGNADLIVSEISKQSGSCWLDVITSLPLTIPPGSSADVTVTIDAGCASAGTHNDLLVVYSNDPDENPYPDGVNVSLTVPEVNEVIYDVSGVDTDSGGNEDGVVNPGETVSMDVNLRNLGNGVATDVSAVISTTSPYVNILDDTISYNAIGGEGSQEEGDHSIQYEVSSETPGNAVIFFTLHISSTNGGPWEDEFAVVAVPDTTPPYVPSSPSPGDETTAQPTDISLTWSGGDPDGDQVAYDVYVFTEHPFRDLSAADLGCTGVTTPICGLDLDPGTRYFWYVVATDEHNATTSSPIWEFVTKAAHQIFLPVVLRND